METRRHTDPRNGKDQNPVTAVRLRQSWRTGANLEAYVKTRGDLTGAEDHQTLLGHTRSDSCMDTPRRAPVMGTPDRAHTRHIRPGLEADKFLMGKQRPKESELAMTSLRAAPRHPTGLDAL